MNQFKFYLGEHAKILISGENGVIIGRSQYLNHQTGYLLRYVNTQGCACETWFDEDALGSMTTLT